MTENIYLALELSLDPPITDVTALKDELNKKINEWNKLAIASPKFQHKVAKAKAFLKTIDDNQRLLVEQADEARRQKLKLLHYAISQQEMAGKIDKKGLKKLTDSFSCFTENTIKKESVYTESESFLPPVIPPSLKCNRLIPAIEMEALRQDFSIIENGKFQNLYDLLGLTFDTERKVLYDQAKEKNEINQRAVAKTTEVSAKARLLGKAMHYFKDDYEQLDYDAALKREKFDLLCKQTLQHRAVKGIITTEIYRKSIGDACQQGLSQQEAEWLVYEYYCIKLKCPPPIEMNVSQPRSLSDTDEKPFSFWSWLLSLAPRPFPNPDDPETNNPQKTPPVDDLKSIAIHEEPTLLLESFHYANIQDAVTPINEYTLPMILRDKVFWQASALCVLPLGIITLDGKDNHFFTDLLVPVFWLFCLVGFLVVFGRMIRKLILRYSEDVRLPIAAFFITAAVGTPLLLLAYRNLPHWFFNLSQNKENQFLFLLGCLFHHGLFEETCKTLPVLAYLIYYRGKSSLKMAFFIGVFSSMGLFADKIFLFFSLFKEHLPQIFTSGLPVFQLELSALIYDNDVNKIFSNALPIFSLMIANIIWTALFAYYISCAMIAGMRWWMFLLIGLAISSCLHGVYIYLVSNNFNGIAALLTGCSFVAFYGYLAKIRIQLVPARQNK
ncbi:MAG: PrsW family intramembrane metalloprotease [Planctomycetaceae bacterium]|jgi:RsiW-degrading membrane proteinase PrsW (M82 family)|nr:PrsW family intramembrane metalloprotease [Planctomycetaceae bacterium]